MTAAETQSHAAWWANEKARRVFYEFEDRKAKARRLVKRAVRAGEMSRSPCESCGNPKVHGHHDDYYKPLAVRWLCASCHCRLHVKDHAAGIRRSFARPGVTGGPFR